MNITLMIHVRTVDATSSKGVALDEFSIRSISSYTNQKVWPLMSSRYDPSHQAHFAHRVIQTRHCVSPPAVGMHICVTQVGMHICVIVRTCVSVLYVSLASCSRMCGCEAHTYACICM